MNTNLYSLSFLLVTNGITGCSMCICYFLVDVVKGKARIALQPLKFFGMNAIAMYVLAEAGPVQWFFSCFYVEVAGQPSSNAPDNSLANVLWPTGVLWPAGPQVPSAEHGWKRDPAIMAWTLGYIAFWMAVAYIMHRRRWYVKI